jgi:hypothetical protein
MKVVREMRSISHIVLAVRCDRCRYLVSDDAASSDSVARIDIDLGLDASVLAADLCRRCVAEFLACLTGWRDVLRTVATYDEIKGYRYYDFEMLDADSSNSIRIQSLLDEPRMR